MRIFKILLIIISFAIFFSACSIINKKYQKTFSYDYNVNTYGKNVVLIDNLNGKFKIIQSDDSVLRINYKTTLILKKNELEKELIPLKLKVDTLNDKLVIKVIEKISEIKFLKFGKSHKEDYEIYVPKNLIMEINSNFSDIYIENLINDFRINLVDGDVKIKKPKGNYTINIVNGKIQTDADSLKNLSVNITNGKFYLLNSNEYYGNFNLNVENGKILYKQLNFDNIIKSDKKSFVAKRGASDNKLSVNIVNGRIYLKENAEEEEKNTDN